MHRPLLFRLALCVIRIPRGNDRKKRIENGKQTFT